MKSFLNFFFGEKKQYIGLSSFKTREVKKAEPLKRENSVQKSTLTGLIKRVG